MHNTKLSIIIPAYNLENYIRKCLDSIIFQYKKGLEVIIVDDGSKDSTSIICKEYSQKYNYIKYIYQDNAGVSAARNHGLKEALGEYIWFVDGDDYILDNAIDNVFSKIEKQVDIIAGGFIKVYSDDISDVIPKIDESEIKKVDGLNYPSNLIYALKNNYYYPALWTNIYKKDLFSNNKIFLNETIKYTEDIDCYLNLLINSKTISIINKNYAYRQQRVGAATSKITEKRVKDNFWLIKTWYDKLEKLELNNDLKNQIIEFLKYEYIITVGFLFSLNKNEFDRLYPVVKEYSFLISNSDNAKVKFSYFVMKILGYNLTGKLLSKYIRSKMR